MENKYKGIAWFGNICKKFEDVCLEMDDFISLETFKKVESQLQTVGANVKQFCSDLMQDVHPPSSEDTVEGAVPGSSLVQNSDVLTQKKLNSGSYEDHSKKGPSNVNHSLCSSSVEPIKSIHFDFSLEQIVDTYQKSEVSIKENPNKETLFQLECMQFDFSLAQAFYMCEKSELSVEEYPIKEKQLQLEMSAVNSQAEILLPAPDDVTGCNFSMGTEEGSSNLVDASASVSSPIPSSSSLTLIESCDSKVPKTEVVLGGASTESIQRSDDSITEEARDNDVTKLCLETVHSSDKLKLDESCIVVDGNEFCSVSCETPKQRSYKKKLHEAFASKLRLTKKQDFEQNATWFGDLDAGTNQQNGRTYPSSTLTKSSDSLDHEFCESEWEII